MKEKKKKNRKIFLKSRDFCSLKNVQTQPCLWIFMEYMLAFIQGPALSSLGSIHFKINFKNGSHSVLKHLSK